MVDEHLQGATEEHGRLAGAVIDCVVEGEHGVPLDNSGSLKFGRLHGGGEVGGGGWGWSR